jgi:prepilin-type processing-associated H-X9-DG protein
MKAGNQLWNAPVGSYGYNAAGSAGSSGQALGLGGEGIGWEPTRAASVRVPAEMIAMGDAHLSRGFHSDDAGAGSPPKPNGHFYLSGNIGIVQLRNAEPMRAIRGRHQGSFNLVFCDGHVAGMRADRLFAKIDSARRLWNRDYQPHRELIP